MPETPPAQPDDKPRVLIVDDEKFIRDILADFLGMEGYVVRTAQDGISAITELERARYDVVVSDLKMPNMGGLELLREVAARHPNTLTVIMTGFGTVETAIDAMKRGAFDYVLKPFKAEEIVHVVQRGLEKRRLEAENLRLKEALSLYKVSEAIAASLSMEEVVATVTEGGVSELRADYVSTWLENGVGGYFERSLGRAPALPEMARAGELDAGVICSRLSRGDLVVEHGHRAAELFSRQPAPPAESVVAVPLEMRGRLMGWIVVVSVTPHRRFDEGERKLLRLIASRAAASIENARLYENLQSTFKQTIQGLATAIDKMDRYTAGHSQRVSGYAVALARWLELPELAVETVRQSALMHDIGKVGCVMNLNKPGKLTNAEYEVFQRHPVYGREILDPIGFLRPVIPGVYLHHERWDGRGYPEGLAGNSIPLTARIIAVADTYDAMTTDRAYRPALPHEVTVNEIVRFSGTQFDPELAGTFTDRIDSYRDELRDLGEKVPE